MSAYRGHTKANMMLGFRFWKAFKLGKVTTISDDHVKSYAINNQFVHCGIRIIFVSLFKQVI